MIIGSSLSKAVLPEHASIKQALQNLIETSLQIVLIINNNDEFIGIVTDGDIRRGFLRGETLDSALTRVLKQNPFVVSPEVSRDVVKSLMKSNKIHQVPVIQDDTHKIIGLHLWDENEIQIERDNTMVIMAGGKGARLRPHTENCPKPMLPVSGKPMLEHIINRASQDGFKHFIIAIHYLGKMIEDYFCDGKKWGVKIEYCREKKPLGTAGALTLLGKSAV